MGSITQLKVDTEPKAHLGESQNASTFKRIQVEAEKIRSRNPIMLHFKQLKGNSTHFLKEMSV